MMAFPSMLVEAAKQANMVVPDDPDNFSADDFPHFHCFCALQLCRPIQWGEHWDNAKVIAAVPMKKIKKLTLEDFIARGLHFQS